MMRQDATIVAWYADATWLMTKLPCARAVTTSGPSTPVREVDLLEGISIW